MEGKKAMKVLVVDDEVFIRELIVEYLSMKGYEVFSADNGREAIDRFEAESPEVMLLDIKMPGISGIEALRKIKDTGKDVFVIMLSAFGDFETVQETLRTGANCYMEKPFTLERLDRTLKAYKDSRSRMGEE
jgi:two-component system response regulator (stage 0 sporulation protein F)